MAARRGRPFSSECMCTNTGRTCATDSRAPAGRRRCRRRCRRRRGAPSRCAAWRARPRGGLCTRQEGEELAHLLGVHLADHQAARVHAACLGEQGRDVGAVIDAQPHAERAFPDAGRSGPRSMATKRSSTETSSKSELSHVGLAGRAVAEDDQRAAVAVRGAGQASRPWPPLRVPPWSGPGRCRGDHAGRRPPRRRTSSRSSRTACAVRTTKCSRYAAHLRLQQAAQDLEMLARALSDVAPARAC